MAPKKKTKTTKLANMSEEEKLRYMQHKVLMEEEVHRRKRQIIGTFTNIKLKHEEYFSRLNSAKINQQWRHILRKIKREKLAEDISNLEQYENVLRYKVRFIVELLSDFDRAEFQYSLQFQQHVDAITNFLKVHHRRLPTLCMWYKDMLNNIGVTNIDRTRAMMASVDEDFRNMKAKRGIAKRERTNALENSRLAYNDQKNDLQTKLLYRSVKVEEKYADRVLQLQREYETILQQYKSHTDSKLAHYRILSQKDDADVSHIERHYQATDLTRRLERKRIQLEELRDGCQREENNLISRKDELTGQVRNLRRQYDERSDAHRTQLRLLVNSSNSVLKDLNSIRVKGAHILRIVDHCVKLKTGENHDQIAHEECPHENNDGTLTVLRKRLHAFWRISKGVIVANEQRSRARRRARDENEKLHKLLRYHVSSFRRSRSVPRKYGF